MIKSHGSSRPTAFFIGDSPHGDDLKTGFALVGHDGNVLRDFCKEVNLDLDKFWRSCLIKEEFKEPDDKEKRIEATKKALDQYGPILIEEINDLKPNLLIPLGEISFNYLTNLRSIRKFRGSILPPSGQFALAQENLKVLPILGPYPYLNQEYRLRVISRIDFTKIPKYLNDKPIPDKVYNIWVAKSSSALRAFFDRAYQKTMKEGGFLVFDIETYFQIPVCISFCFDGFESVCVPLLDGSIDQDHRILMMQLVAKVLKSPIPKVNQNIKYDWKILERWGFEVNNVIGDTMLATSTLYCEFPKNLGFLTSIYTEIPYFKDEGKTEKKKKKKKEEQEPGEDDNSEEANDDVKQLEANLASTTRRERYYLYNAKDSLATSQIYSQQQTELVELGTKYVYDNLIRIMPIYRKMEDRGIRIDKLQQVKLLDKYESLFHIQELKIRRLLNRDYFNPISPKQCRKVIFEELGYKKLRGMKTTTSGEPSTDEESLDLLIVYGESERAPSTGPMVLSSIQAARKIHKVIEVLELHLHPDERFRCEYNLAGTETGRSSAGETTDQLIYINEKGQLKEVNLGHSLQTVGKHGFMIDGETYGKDLRSMFVPSPGFVFVEVDLKSAEAMVDRVLSGNFDMGVFDNPGIHRLTGSWVYDCLPSDIKKGILIDGVDRYHMAKTVRHAGERNMGAERMVMMTQRPLRECKQILDKFHQFQPEIKGTFHKEIRQAIDRPEHELRAPNGRLRAFYDRIDKGTYNEGISFLPQAIVTDQTKFHGIGKTYCNPSIYKWAALLAESHDSALSEVHRDRALEFARIFKTNIESEPIDFSKCTLKRNYKLTIPAEVSMGESWAESSMEEVVI